MKRLHHDDEVQHIREQLRLRIDAAVKSVAEVLQVAADLFIATGHRKADEGRGINKVEAAPVPEMMTPQQAADYLGVKASTLGVWRCRRSYPIPFVKVGSKVCYRKSDLDRFLQQRTENRGDDDPQ
jgi:excisionase family DNA binding protein